MEFEGEFESHITVRVQAFSKVEALREWAASQSLKFHHIILDRGLTPSQPMVGRRSRGVLSDEMAIAADLCRRLALGGFTVSRVKIEAAPGNRDIPDSDAEAADRHSGRYFEHHIKLILNTDSDLVTLCTLAEAHTAHLSRNALRVREDGRREHFVTQRCHNVGRSTARRRLDDLLEALTGSHYSILVVEEEFVVHDSNPDVDAGWIEFDAAS